MALQVKAYLASSLIVCLICCPNTIVSLSRMSAFFPSCSHAHTHTTYAFTQKAHLKLSAIKRWELNYIQPLLMSRKTQFACSSIWCIFLLTVCETHTVQVTEIREVECRRHSHSLYNYSHECCLAAFSFHRHIQTKNHEFFNGMYSRASILIVALTSVSLKNAYGVQF